MIDLSQSRLISVFQTSQNFEEITQKRDPKKITECVVIFYTQKHTTFHTHTWYKCIKRITMTLVRACSIYAYCAHIIKPEHDIKWSRTTHAHACRANTQKTPNICNIMFVCLHGAIGSVVRLRCCIDWMKSAFYILHVTKRHSALLCSNSIGVYTHIVIVIL